MTDLFFLSFVYKSIIYFVFSFTYFCSCSEKKKIYIVLLEKVDLWMHSLVGMQRTRNLVQSLDRTVRTQIRLRSSGLSLVRVRVPIRVRRQNSGSTSQLRVRIWCKSSGEGLVLYKLN